MIRVGVNGFGRIGRTFVSYIFKNPDLDIHIVGINDLMEEKDAAYLLRYDSVRGKYPGIVSFSKGTLIVDGVSIPFTHKKNPEECLWSDVDVVVEATGVFTSYKKAQLHQRAGARHVIITAPVKDVEGGMPGETVIIGVNEEKLKVCTLSSNASCTTNAVAIPLQVLEETLGIHHAILTAVHAYTGTQGIVDSVHRKKQRLGRAGAQNIVPSSTGAAIATSKVIPSLEDKFDGVSLRVPVVCGSIADITLVVKKKTTAEEVNRILTDASEHSRYRDILGVTDEPLVSSDIIGSKYAALVDTQLTRVVDSVLVKVFSWYDNELGYVHTLTKQIQHIV